MYVINGDGAERGATKPSGEEAVERALVYSRAHAGEPIPIRQLCRVVGLSERSLRNAFYRVHGMSPKQWLVAERLREVRHALSGTGDELTTVTDVATRFGFYELGRFAATYRKAFGERPSATLRGAARKSAAAPTHN
jgi:transcriptional regulator GlxA family with amidase domain